MRTNTF